MSSYTPKPGSVAYRILGWLEAQGREKEFNSSQIANALDIDTRAVQSLMQQSLAAGLVFRRQKDRTHPLAPYWWSLTNHGVRQREFTPNPVGWMNVKKDADEVPVFCEVSGRTKSPRMADADSGVGVSAPMTTPSPTVTNLPGQPITRKDAEESGSKPGTPGAPDGVVTSSAPRAADDAPSGEGPAAADAPRARAAEFTDAKFALFCDGELMVSCGGTVIQLKAEHVQRLRRLLGGGA